MKNVQDLRQVAGQVRQVSLLPYLRVAAILQGLQRSILAASPKLYKIFSAKVAVARAPFPPLSRPDLRQGQPLLQVGQLLHTLCPMTAAMARVTGKVRL